MGKQELSCGDELPAEDTSEVDDIITTFDSIMEATSTSTTSAKEKGEEDLKTKVQLIRVQKPQELDNYVEDFKSLSVRMQCLPPISLGNSWLLGSHNSVQQNDQTVSPLHPLAHPSQKSKSEHNLSDSHLEARTRESGVSKMESRQTFLATKSWISQRTRSLLDKHEMSSNVDVLYSNLVPYIQKDEHGMMLAIYMMFNLESYLCDANYKCNQQFSKLILLRTGFFSRFLVIFHDFLYSPKFATAAQ